MLLFFQIICWLIGIIVSIIIILFYIQGTRFFTYKIKEIKDNELFKYFELCGLSEDEKKVLYWISHHNCKLPDNMITTFVRNIIDGLVDKNIIKLIEHRSPLEPDHYSYEVLINTNRFYISNKK